MGKIIEFPRNIIPEQYPKTEGIEMYFRFYKNCSGRLKRQILMNIEKDTTRKTYNGEGELWKKVEAQDGLELIGYASAKKIVGDTKTTAKYYKKLAEIIEKYSLEVLKSVKTN